MSTFAPSRPPAWPGRPLPPSHTWAPPKFQQGGQKKIFQGGGLQKETQGGGLFSKLRVWVERGLKEKFSSATAILEKNSLKIKKNIYKFVFVFFFHFLWVREGEALENVNFSLVGGSIIALGRGIRF